MFNILTRPSTIVFWTYHALHKVYGYYNNKTIKQSSLDRNHITMALTNNYDVLSRWTLFSSLDNIDILLLVLMNRVLICNSGSWILSKAVEYLINNLLWTPSWRTPVVDSHVMHLFRCNMGLYQLPQMVNKSKTKKKLVFISAFFNSSYAFALYTWLN